MPDNPKRLQDADLISVAKLTSFEALEAFVQAFEDDLLGGRTKPWPPEARTRIRTLANLGLTRALEVARTDTRPEHPLQELARAYERYIFSLQDCCGCSGNSKLGDELAAACERENIDRAALREDCEQEGISKETP